MREKMKIKGMHCKSCEIIIKESLEEIGAEKVESSYKTGDITLDYDESKLDLQKIKQTIEKEGYKVI